MRHRIFSCWRCPADLAPAATDRPSTADVSWLSADQTPSPEKEQQGCVVQ